MAAVAFTNPKFSPKIITTSVSRNYLTQSFFNPRIPTIPKSSSSNLKTLSFKPQIVRCQSFNRQPPPPKFWRPDEQSPGASLTSKEKLDIARQLAKLDVDIIEAGFPAASKDDFEAVKMIAKEVGNSVDADGYVPKDIRRAWEALKYAKRPRIHTFIATSPIHMEYKLRKTKKEVIEIARSMVKFARSLGCEDVEFSPENAGRSEREFLYEILGEVIKAGATILNIPDTWGKNCKIIMDTGNNRAGNFLKWKLVKLREVYFIGGLRWFHWQQIEPLLGMTIHVAIVSLGDYKHQSEVFNGEDVLVNQFLFLFFSNINWSEFCNSLLFFVSFIKQNFLELERTNNSSLEPIKSRLDRFLYTEEWGLDDGDRELRSRLMNQLEEIVFKEMVAWRQEMKFRWIRE
ncbi:hypothetical protein UlMin_044252 [Ulmus minor]